MRMPSYSALCSFVFSTILTSALIPSSGNVSLASAGAPAVQMAVQTALGGLRAEGMAGGTALELPVPATTPTAAPAAAPSAPASALTPEIMKKMLQLIAAKGTDREAVAAYANPLGLTAAGQGWPDRQISAKGNDIVIHGFAVSRGSDQDLLLYSNTPTIVHIYRANRNGKIVTALLLDKSAGQIITRAPAEAQSDLDAEFVYWAANVDSLIADKIADK
jgi:hypothetical protein